MTIPEKMVRDKLAFDLNMSNGKLKELRKAYEAELRVLDKSYETQIAEVETRIVVLTLALDAMKDRKKKRKRK